MSEAEIIQCIDAAPEAQHQLYPIELCDFLTRTFPPREMILHPVIPSRGLAMLYAPRGIGKTYLALHMAYAAACGGNCLSWRADKPRRVVYIDGEMPAAALQTRLIAIADSFTTSPPPGYFRLLSDSLLPEGMPDLADPTSWDILWPFIKDAELIVLDNLSTLCRHGRENESESWVPVQENLLRLRRAGVSVLMVHHAGKGGQQRGTSKREDVLDTVIALRRPADYQPQEGARFEVHIEKARGFHGEEAEPFEARLQVNDAGVQWTVTSLANAKQAQASLLFEQGMKVREVAAEVGISKTTAGRFREQWQGGKANG